MNSPQPQWYIYPPQEIPQWFLEVLKRYSLESEGKYAAQLLWQRGIKDPLKLPEFLDPDAYQPTSSFVFGQEMKWAVKRIQKAINLKEKVTIWGDFDADGITATSVLWEGLGQFFTQGLQLNYYIPDRFRESHGLNCTGIEKLASQGTKLIITCDTGSTNIKEIEYAHELGIDTIITDHHTIPEDRPPATAIINPRYFAESHPLFHLSGVAVAYKLVEALYEILPQIPRQPLENLLDLVAIGLIADLVQLKGDCRYLAQKGIQQLQKQLQKTTRPGIAYLLKYCQKTGDRPTDISFGIGPRINAISRIHGQADFGVELLTNQDAKHCQKLAEETELANTRRKGLQKEMVEQVKRKIARLDLSTTSVILLEDPQWQSGILGLVAGQIAQEYGRPTILLTTAEEGENSSLKLARGSARSVNNIDLYQLVKSQEHLLHRFGGHPLAAGLSLPIENIPLFQDGINQQLKQQITDPNLIQPRLEIDLIVTVADLGKALFKELKLLEPYGMGNPIPKLLIKNCWFENVWHNNTSDFKGKKIQYIRTTFELFDDSVVLGFPGIWWEHYKDELPENERFDAVVELDFNTHNNRYEVRLITVRPSLDSQELTKHYSPLEFILDWRNQTEYEEKNQPSELKMIKDCPQNWDQLKKNYRQAINQQEKLALAYSWKPSLSPQETWRTLMGIAKYYSRTNQPINPQQIQDKLSLTKTPFNLGLEALSGIGFNYQLKSNILTIKWSAQIAPDANLRILRFIESVKEEKFQQQYFCQVPFEFISFELSKLT